MNRTIIALAATCIFLTGCPKPPEVSTSPPKPNPAAQAIDYARQIVSDPSNWKGNTVLLTDLGATAQDLGIADTPEFKEFDSAAQALIQFGTTWVTTLDEATMSRLRSELSQITSKTEASAETQIRAGPPSAPVGGGLQVTSDTRKDSARVQADAERAIYTSIDGLRAAQADEFGKLFARAQTGFRALRLLLQIKLTEPSRALQRPVAGH